MVLRHGGGALLVTGSPSGAWAEPASPAPPGRRRAAAPLSSQSVSHLHPGDVVAVTLPPGEGWRGAVAAVWEAEAALFPVDHRLPAAARRALVARACPTAVLGPEGWSRAEGGRPADPSAALIVATSGSTRRPRLVELSRDAVTAAVSASLASLGAGTEDGWVSCLPLAHIGGLLVVLRALLGGAPLLFRSPDGIAPEPGWPFISVVPTQLVRALDAGIDLRGYRAMLAGGSGLPPHLRERSAAAGAAVVQTYGQTESCGGVVYDGVPLPGVSMRIAVQGEIELAGPTLMTGYRDAAPAPAPRRPAHPGGGPFRAADRLTSDGWLRTGDAGWIDGAGRLHVRGRIDQVIVTGGEKVWPGEVEAVLRTHPDVADCAVFARPDREWGERVAAAIVARDPASPPGLEALRDHVGSALGRHLAPRELVLVTRLPRTALGKLRRQALRDL